jgi:hypothetical protein
MRWIRTGAEPKFDGEQDAHRAISAFEDEFFDDGTCTISL